jgi:hypothetical protein
MNASAKNSCTDSSGLTRTVQDCFEAVQNAECNYQAAESSAADLLICNPAGLIAEAHNMNQGFDVFFSLEIAIQPR